MRDASHRPPETEREELVELLHGHEVADPYRWLEAPAHDERVAAFIDAQDTVARAELASLPTRDAFTERLQQLWNHPRRSTPWRRGRWWFQLRNDGLQDQDVLWAAAGAPPADQRDRQDEGGGGVAAGPLPEEDHWRVLVDPNTWSSDGTASLSGLAVSDDGARVAVGRAEAGSDWTTWQVVEVADARTLADEVPW